MPHASDIVTNDGPDGAHAFDLVPIQPRNGALDALCPICRGHGQWNVELDLVSFRCKRAICGRCFGAGWIETGNDPVGVPDIVRTPEGYPKWVVRYEAVDASPDGPLAVEKPDSGAAMTDAQA